MTPEIAIVMGSDSDLPVMQESAKVLQELGIPYHISIVSAHRTPKRLFHFAEKAASNGFKVIIAGAGGAAHLPGMIASVTPLPVIGVPVASKNLSGQDSLLSIVQMPPGVPVATVAINGARNAGILAAQMLGLHAPTILSKVTALKEKMRAEVEQKAERLEKIGFAEYLNTGE